MLLGFYIAKDYDSQVETEELVKSADEGPRICTF